MWSRQLKSLMTLPKNKVFHFFFFFFNTLFPHTNIFMARSRCHNAMPLQSFMWSYKTTSLQWKHNVRRWRWTFLLCEVAIKLVDLVLVQGNCPLNYNNPPKTYGLRSKHSPHVHLSGGHEKFLACSFVEDSGLDIFKCLCCPLLKHKLDWWHTEVVYLAIFISVNSV